MAPSADQSRAPSLFGFVADAARRISRLFPPGQRRTAAIAVGVAGAALLVVALAAGPVVRSVATSRAEAMGLRLAIRDAGIAWGAVRLAGVTITSPELPGVTAELDRVDVVPGLTGSVRRVRVRGGTVLLRGSSKELEDELRAYRTVHDHGGGHGGATSTLPLSVDGIDVTWSERSTSAEHVWGLRYDREEDGGERVSADLARLAFGSLRVEASKPSAGFERDEDGRKLVRVGAEHLAALADVGDGGDDPADPAPDQDPPQKTHNPVLAPAEHASSHWLRLRTELARTAELATKTLRPATVLELPDVRFEIRHAGQVLNVGPAKAVLERTRAALKGSVTSGEGERAPPIRFDITVPLAGGAVDVGLTGGPVSLAALGVKEHDMGLEDVGNADVEVSGRALLDADGSSVHLSGGARLSDASVFQPRLSRELIRGLRLGFDGQADVALDGTSLRFSNVGVELGKVKLLANGNLDRGEGHARGALHVEIPLAACSDMLASVPEGLVPLLSGLGVTGTFAFSGDVSFDTRRPKDTRVVADAGNGCKITRVPDNLSTERFSRPWTRTVLDASRNRVTIESGPGTPNWVPFYDISPYLATAVVVCEDANFFTHNGFNQKSIQDSIRDDLTAGRFVRGGSTVTMQLAKNLYLEREKTLSRKLQEAVFTVLLEQRLTKEQILELYLNVIEFAPGLYGIGPAAQHYFNSTPRDLSLGQALYLISLLPNPKIHHFKADGSLSDKWTEYLRHLMDIAHKIRRIDDRELATALAEEVHRGVAASESEAAGANDDAPEFGTPERPDPDGP